MAANRSRYLESLSAELAASVSRVRDLIGDRHWLTDGYHKEHILREIIARHLPAGVNSTRGFVISPSDENACSREQDILVIDISRETPVFNRADLAIAFPQQVLAAVSVKTKLSTKDLKDAVDTLRTARLVADASRVDEGRIWYGAFFFEECQAVRRSPARLYDYLSRLGTIQLPDVIATADRLVYRIFAELSHSCREAVVTGFQGPAVGSAVFLGNLLDHVATQRGAPRAEFTDFATGISAVALDPPEFRLRTAP